MARILIVEDSPTIAAGLRLILEPQNHQVFIAADGLSAFASLNQARPNLILMDIGLPGIQGLDLCLTLRQMPAFSAIPIIIVTGSHRHIDFAMAQRMGASGYITKPVNPDELLALVEREVGSQAA